MASLLGAVTGLSARGTPGPVTWFVAPVDSRDYVGNFTDRSTGGLAGRIYGDFTRATAPLASLSVSDTASLSATEEPIDRNEIATTDTARLSASDVSQLFNRIDATDTATLSAGETIALQISGVTLKVASDTATLSASETSTVGVTVGVSDTATLTATDTSSVAISAESKNVTDTANLSADDSVLLEIFAGIVERSASDTALLRANDFAVVAEVRRIRHIKFQMRKPRMTIKRH